LALAVAVVPACLLAAGCGGGQAPAASPAVSHAAKPPKPVGPPPARESVRQAEKRIQRLASSNDCDVVDKLNLLHRPDLKTKAHCDSLRNLAGLKAVGGEAYGDAGVIDYALGIRTMSVVLLRQPDGLFHVAFPDYFVGRASIGTKYAHQFDPAAQRAVKAMRIHRCGLFRANAVTELGPGSLSKTDACAFVDHNPVATVFSSYPEASIDRLGGNGNFAFYGIGGPGGYLTLVFAHETRSDYLPNGEKLPKGAPAYGFAGVYLTNGPKKKSANG
jgi:hypothetical protein